jgi:hypothetical protein
VLVATAPVPTVRSRTYIPDVVFVDCDRSTFSVDAKVVCSIGMFGAVMELL